MPTTVLEGQDRSTERNREAAVRKLASRRTSETPIDWAHLSRFTLNDKALEHEVLDLFAMDAPRYLAKMDASRGRKDWIEAAHTLKGSARAVGAWSVAECSELVESLLLAAKGEHAELAESRRMVEALDMLSRSVRGTVAYIEQLTATARASSAQ
jgi:HPt (histidine-containing phosphotransfer) domain-containing protein